MSPLLVDSSIYIAHLRAGQDVRQALLPHLQSAMLYNCGVVRAEVLRGMKSERTRDGLEAFFDIIPEVPCDAKIWRWVAQKGWELGRKGKWPPVTDLLIAACAHRVNATLATLDQHFDDIPGLRIVESIPA
jgi:predicted nucleic acid-binding protein